ELLRSGARRTCPGRAPSARNLAERSVPHHEHGALGVGDEGRGHRAEDHAEDPARAAAAHHQHPGLLALLDEPGRGLAAPAPGGQARRATVPEHLGERALEELLAAAAELLRIHLAVALV